VSRRFLRLFYLVVFLVVGFITLFPFYWVFALGTHLTREILTGYPVLPGSALMHNLSTVLDKSNMVLSFFNSLFISSASTVMNVMFSVLCGFAFAKYQFKSRQVLFLIVLATMMIPGQMGLVAFVKQMQFMGWYNTFWPLILSFGSAFGVFWMRQYIADYVPTEMLEAARIDGSGEFRIIFLLTLPMIAPAVGAYAIITFVNSWNSYLFPLVLLQDETKFTLPMAISSMQNRLDIDYGAQFLAISLGTLPLIAVFLVASQKVINGIAQGAIKG
jgi:multiple sugar transport system permease protein